MPISPPDYFLPRSAKFLLLLLQRTLHPVCNSQSATPLQHSHLPGVSCRTDTGQSEKLKILVDAVDRFGRYS